MPKTIERHKLPRLTAEEMERLFEYYRNVAEKLILLSFTRPPVDCAAYDIKVVMSDWLPPTD